MKNLVKATCYRMIKSNGVRISYLLTALAAASYYVLVHQIAAGSLSAANAGSVTGLGDPMVLWLFGPLVTGLLICLDFENRTIHGAMCYGRGKILLHYMVVYTAAILLLTLPYLLGSLFCIIRDVNMTGAEGITLSVYMDNVFRAGTVSAGKLAMSYLSWVFVYVGQISICIPIAIKTRKTIVVTAFGFFFGMLTALLAALAEKSAPLDAIYGITPYAYTFTEINAEASYAKLFCVIVVSVVYMGVMGAVAYLLFRKAEIK